jgi:hypothetical protein
MAPALTVFLCSTFSDLVEEREGVLDAIRRLQLKHDSMEFFGARTGQPIETCLAEVRKSDILVVIVGHRYGSIAPDMEVSFSEAEYGEGHRLDKPCLVYIRGDDVPILPKFMERDPGKLQRLEEWKATLQDRHTVATFAEKSDLAVQVAADLGRTISDFEAAERTKEDARAKSPVHVIDELKELVDEAISKGVSEEVIVSTIRRAVSAMISAAEHVKATVFLSYSAPDREIVREVARGLDNAGIRVWFDESKLKPGSNWVREIERGLDKADFVIFFMSPNSVNSEWAQKELQIAMHRKISGEGGARILPVLLKQVEVPPLLRDIHWLDMTHGDAGKAVYELLGTIRHYQKRDNYIASVSHPEQSKSMRKLLEHLRESGGLLENYL